MTKVTATLGRNFIKSKEFQEAQLMGLDSVSPQNGSQSASLKEKQRSIRYTGQLPVSFTQGETEVYQVYRTAASQLHSRRNRGLSGIQKSSQSASLKEKQRSIRYTEQLPVSLTQGETEVYQVYRIAASQPHSRRNSGLSGTEQLPVSFTQIETEVYQV